MSAELLRLAERCEKETAGSRELDLAIYRAEFPFPCVELSAAAQDKFDREKAPTYTSSLDAAMSLIVGRSLWSVCDMEDGPYAQVIRPMPGGGYVNGLTTAKAATPALALTAACLRARAAAARGESRSKSDE